MNKKHSYFEQLCELAVLMNAWKAVRANKGAAGVDLVTIAGFERELLGRLQDLSERLRQGRYYPMPLRTVQMKKASGGLRTLGILTVEDRIVQRALLDVLEPLWEPAFSPYSFGFRPGRNVEMAVKCVLDYRQAGDAYVVDADIQDCFGSLDHELLMRLVAARVKDKRLLALIRMYLDSGQALGGDEAGDAPLLERLSDYASESVNAAVGHLLDERGYGGYQSYGQGYGQALPEDYAAPDETEVRKQARKEALKRLGRDAALFGLTYLGRTRRLLSPASLALTGAAVVAGAAYPVARRALRKRFGLDPARAGAVQGGALSPLLCNIYLHEFDVALTRAGLRFVRYADDFVICCRDETEARRALETAARKLEELKLRLHPDKTRLVRFDQGLEFLGYRFAQFTNNAAPLPAATSVTAVARDKLAPAVAQLKQSAAAQTKKGTQQLAALRQKLKKKG